ncbi:MAG: hypothetical protein IJW13_02985 [Clostridia bacterium]|nr:hypothetical protein [Clostridia bacterium]
MKKVLTFAFCLILSISTAIFAVACNSSPDLYSCISELRKDTFVGECEHFNLTIYCGAKENPSAFDGVKNPTSLFVTLKVTQSQATHENLTATFTVGEKQYSAQLKNDNVKNCLTAELTVSALPEKALEVTIYNDQTSAVINATSILRSDTVTYTQAVNSAGEKAKDFIKQNTVKGILKAEIIVRLLNQDSNNYYYVGFVTAEGLKQAYLIDAKTGNVIAQKIN